MRAWLLPLLLGLTFVPTGSAATCGDTSLFETCVADAPADCASVAADDAAWWAAYGLSLTGGQGAGVYTTCEDQGSAAVSKTRVASGGNPRVASTGVRGSNDFEVSRTTTDDGTTSTSTCKVRVVFSPRVDASPLQPPGVGQTQNVAC